MEVGIYLHIVIVVVWGCEIESKDGMGWDVDHHVKKDPIGGR